jgi:MFS family permease
MAMANLAMATGILVSGSSIALLLLGPLIPYILQSFPGAGWRVCWYSLGGLTLLIALLTYFFLRNHPEELNLNPFGKPPRLAFMPLKIGPPPGRYGTWPPSSPSGSPTSFICSISPLTDQ